ncbi:hypothetical protein KP509_05G015400 [Ceratopteris richardii]|uniref:Uncharacterized protein n=1 Tax=Ceratopteris richardii TaxID=49495 RepID=A0A8T2UR31_CERRI|nr:hypothetical protein KP509_05G015400 [Ceratopteris richardii]
MHLCLSHCFFLTRIASWKSMLSCFNQIISHNYMMWTCGSTVNL